MTLVEAAELLGLDPATLRQQIANGVLRARKVGRDWHVTTREVARYRREHRRKVEAMHARLGEMFSADAVAARLDEVAATTACTAGGRAAGPC
jgi:excisionase family DNA binding protein